MTWQTQLFCGLVITSLQQLKGIYKEHNVPIPTKDLEDYETWGETYIKVAGDKSWSVFFESDIDDNFIQGIHRREVIFGYELTARYTPRILDNSHVNGRPPIFPINIASCKSILDNARHCVPDAQIIMMDCHY